MYGPEYNWLLSAARSPRGLSVRLARGGLLTLVVGAFCVACALVSPATPAASPAALAAPAAVALGENAPSELPRILLRLWVLAPSLLPQR